MPRLSLELLKFLSQLLLPPFDGLFSTRSDPLKPKSDHGTPLLKISDRFPSHLKSMPYLGPWPWPWPLSDLHARGCPGRAPMHHEQVSTSGLHTCSFLCLVYSSSRYTCGYVHFFESLLKGSLPRRPALPTLAKTTGPPRSDTSKNKLPNARARLWVEGNREQLSYHIHAISKLLAFDSLQFRSLSPLERKVPKPFTETKLQC